MTQYDSREFSSSRAHEGSFIVYFNGIEIPVQSVDVNLGVWQIPTASVVVAPDKEMQRLGAEDRVQVVVFYLDDIQCESEGKAPEFRLLFEGDITGWSYTNSPSGRALAFKCVNQLRLLHDLYPYFITGLDTLAATIFEPPDPTKVSSTHWGPALFISLLHQGMNPKEGKYIRRPYDFIENFLRAASGQTEQPKLGSVVTTNFFARQFRKLNFVNRFIPSPLIETDIMALPEGDEGGVFPILRALKKSAVMDAILGKVMHFGNNTSAFSMIQQLFLMMYYELAIIPNAPIAQVEMASDINKGGVLGPPKWKNDTIREALELAKHGDVAGIVYKTLVDALRPNRILNYVTKPQWLYGIPPACNVIFPSMITQYNYDENYDAQPTRTYINDERLKDLCTNNRIPGFGSLYVGYPPQVQNELDKRMDPGERANAAVSGKNLLVWPEEFFRGPRIHREVIPDWFQFLEDSKKTDSLKGEDTKLTWEDIKETELIYAHYEFLRTQGEQRNGAVASIFNPYIVPAFPTVIFDNVATGNHVVGYCLNVSHRLTTKGRTTDINFSFAQNLDELMHNIVEARATHPDISSAPIHPVPELRDTIQMLDRAEEYFSLLFHQGAKYTSPAIGATVKTAAFYFPWALNLVLPSGETVFAPDVIDDKDVTTLNKYTNVQPSSVFDTMFRSTDAAMRYISRPICTLEEYIDFHEHGRRINKIGPTDASQGKGAVYYEQIFEFTPVTNESPEFDENNNLVSPPANELPDTRVDWETRLKNYRVKVMKQLHPQEA